MKTPGLIDIQINGFAAVDFNRTDIDAIRLRQVLEVMFGFAVASFTGRYYGVD